MSGYAGDGRRAREDGRASCLEIKTERGRVTPQQLAVHTALREAGAVVATTHGLDAAIRQLETWGLLRGRAALAA